jgi:hypothetical protein
MRISNGMGERYRDRLLLRYTFERIGQMADAASATWPTRPVISRVHPVGESGDVRCSTEHRGGSLMVGAAKWRERDSSRCRKSGS